MHDQAVSWLGKKFEADEGKTYCRMYTQALSCTRTKFEANEGKSYCNIHTQAVSCLGQNLRLVRAKFTVTYTLRLNHAQDQI